MTDTTIEIPDEDSCGRDGHEICLADDTRGAIVHDSGPDCERFHGLRVGERRCSVCDQLWGSQHEGCADLFDDGSRRGSDCIEYLTDGRRIERAK